MSITSVPMPGLEPRAVQLPDIVWRRYVETGDTDPILEWGRQPDISRALATCQDEYSGNMARWVNLLEVARKWKEGPKTRGLANLRRATITRAHNRGWRPDQLADVFKCTPKHIWAIMSTGEPIANP